MLNRKISLQKKVQSGLAFLGIFAFCVGSLTGCKENESKNLISSALVEEEAGFGQDTAKNGDFVENKTFEAKRIYPISDVITSQRDGVWLKEICVKAKQAVKKGDLLVEIEPVTDEILQKKEQTIAKSKEEYEQVLSGYQASMSNLEQNIASSFGTQKQIYEVELQKTRLQYEWFVQDGAATQDELNAELEELRNMQGDLNIYAPYDGIIDTISDVKSGTELLADREILTMHSEEQIMLNVAEGAQLRFGQEVTVETGSGENIKTYKGRVIAANNVRSDAFKTNEAVIKLEEQISAEELKNVRVKASVKELHNVLVVKNYAVGTEKEKNYLSILDGDAILKRRVITGGVCGDYTWILQGLLEGQSVTIQ